MDTKSIGQIAYDAYGEHQHWLTFDQRQMPSWASVRPDIQAAWQVAGQAVLRAAHQATLADVEAERQAADQERGT